MDLPIGRIVLRAIATLLILFGLVDLPQLIAGPTIMLFGALLLAVVTICYRLEILIQILRPDRDIAERDLENLMTEARTLLAEIREYRSREPKTLTDEGEAQWRERELAAKGDRIERKIYLRGKGF